MTTAVRPHARTAAARTTGGGQAADVLVVFGITGDLATRLPAGHGRRHEPWVGS